MTVKISVIIPVYNVEKYLKNCLDSIINQTLKEIEIICVNDGSTDNSLSILKEYQQKDERIKIINRENNGPSAARNTALKVASGEYISFLDSDDYVDLNFCEKMYQAATENNCDIACCNIIRFNEKLKKDLVKYNRIKVAKRPRHKYKLAIIPEHNYVWNKIYNRKKIIALDLAFEEGILFEDVIFSHKVIYYLDKMVSVPNVNYYYRNNPDSIVNSCSEEKMNDYNNAFKTALEFRLKHNVCTLDIGKYPCVPSWTLSIFCIPFITIKKFVNIYRVYLFKRILVFEVKNFFK